MFFIETSKLAKGFYIEKFGIGSINALSQLATNGHLKHIFFSTMFKAPRMALPLVTISLDVCSDLLMAHGFLTKFLTSSRGSL